MSQMPRRFAIEHSRGNWVDFGHVSVPGTGTWPEGAGAAPDYFGGREAA
jgi:hypothetical protein